MLSIIDKNINISNYQWCLSLEEYHKKINIDLFTNKYFFLIDKILTSNDLGEKKEIIDEYLADHFNWLLDELILNSIDAKSENIRLKVDFNEKTNDFKCILIDDWKWKKYQTTEEKRLIKNSNWGMWLWLKTIKKLSNNRFHLVRTKKKYTIAIFKLNKDSFITYMEENIDNQIRINWLNISKFWAKMESLDWKMENLIKQMEKEIWITDFIISKKDFEEGIFPENINSDMIKEIKDFWFTAHSDFLHFYLWIEWEVFCEQEDDKEDF